MSLSVFEWPSYLFDTGENSAEECRKVFQRLWITQDWSWANRGYTTLPVLSHPGWILVDDIDTQDFLDGPFWRLDLVHDSLQKIAVELVSEAGDAAQYAVCANRYAKFVTSGMDLPWVALAMLSPNLANPFLADFPDDPQALGLARLILTAVYNYPRQVFQLIPNVACGGPAPITIEDSDYVTLLLNKHHWMAERLDMMADFLSFRNHINTVAISHLDNL